MRLEPTTVGSQSNPGLFDATNSSGSYSLLPLSSLPSPAHTRSASKRNHDCSPVSQQGNRIPEENELLRVRESEPWSNPF